MHVRRAALRTYLELDDAVDRRCCVFTHNVLARAFGRRAVDLAPTSWWRLYAEPGISPWAPVEAAARAEIAEAISLPPAALVLRLGRWHLCQGWRDQPLAPGSTGHTFLWLALSLSEGELLDSTEGRGPRLLGMQHWGEVAAPFGGGLAVAVLRPAA